MTKAISRQGLALYVFAGEDLPEDNSVESTTKATDFKANKVASTIVGDPEQKARPNTVEQLKEVFAELTPEKRDIAQKYMLKNGALKVEELKETVARTLLLNLQAGLGK